MRVTEDKQIRQAALINLLNAQELTNQAEVVRVMREMGYEVTQPSISRDFRELGVVKIDGSYSLGLGSRVGENYSSASLVRSVVSVGENLIVVKTNPGAASVVAAALDASDIEGLMGSLAGDDSIFLAVSSSAHHDSVSQFVWSKARG